MNNKLNGLTQNQARLLYSALIRMPVRLSEDREDIEYLISQLERILKGLRSV